MNILKTKADLEFSSAGKIKKLTNEQLCVIYQQGNKHALDALIENNKRLIWSRVKKLGKRYNHKLDEEDLFHTGAMGMIKAAGKFSTGRDTRFVTYAIWWIDQHIVRGIIDDGFTVRIPTHYFEQINKLTRIFAQNPGCTKAEIKELAESAGINGDKFEELMQVMENIMTPASLNASVGDEEDNELGDLILEDPGPSVEEQVEKIILKEVISQIMDCLKEREKDIIDKRFGLSNGMPITLEQLGEMYQLTRERIRQIEANAIEKMRHPSRLKLLENYN